MKKQVYLTAVLFLVIGALSACSGKGSGTYPTVTKQISAGVDEITEQPIDTPTPEPTATPTPSPSPTPTPIPHKELSDFDPKDFFKDVVFCGDSLLHHFRMRSGPSVKPEVFALLYFAGMALFVSSSVAPSPSLSPA